MSHTEFVGTLVASLVDHPDAVEVEEEAEGHTRTYFVSVAGDDVGKVIGKSGRVISAIRHVVSAVASKDRERAFVKIVTE